MPTPRPKHRTYCKTCQDFTVHNSEHICQGCDTKFTSYFPNEISQELVLRQRERYKAQKQKEFGGIYGAFMMGFGIQAMMEMGDTRIIECDAGQKEIDENKKELREQAIKKGQEILDDYNTNYKHLGRNDKCICGSNKKFKQCHLIHFRKYLNI